MQTYKGYTRKELITLLAKEKVRRVKKDMESKGEKWDLGDFQTTNTLTKTWEKLYNTYPIISKVSPMFSLSSLYDEMIEKRDKKIKEATQVIKILLLIDRCEEEDKTPRTIIEFKKNYTENDIKKIKNYKWDCFEDFIDMIQCKYSIKKIDYTYNKEINFDYCIYY